MNILTFDIEEWYIYEKLKKGEKNFYEPRLEKYLDTILNKLEKLEIKATFFCLGVIARNQPQIIKKISSKGHEIGCHSDKHLWVTGMSELAFKEDTHIAIDSLEQILGSKIEYYRAPAFSITEKNKWALKVLIEEGITCDSSIFPAKRKFGGFENFPSSKPVILSIDNQHLLEFPMNFVTILNKKVMFSGGGYFRLFPYKYIQKFMEMSSYNMTYFHLRDFDRHQKKIESKFSPNYFFNYYGIDKSFEKFKQFIKENEFISIGDAIKKIDYKEVSKINFKV